MSLPSPTPPVRRVLAGRYRILEKSGSGSLGAVYKVRDEVEGRVVALKILRIEQLLANAASKMAEEFRAIASLRHPQIARAYDFGFTDDGRVPFFTREYIEGTPLGPGPPASCEPAAFLEPILDLLEALAYVHEQGVLHLDIHAGNLIVSDEPERGSVLIDFGIAQSRDNPLVRANAGTWPSIAPELIGRGLPVIATDIYAVGRLLLYRIAGQTRGNPALPREIVDWGPRMTLELERIAAKALERNPADRFPSAEAMHESLARAAGTRRGTRRVSEPRQIVFGRAAELAAIDAAIDAALDGASRVLSITSPAGYGKTRLLAETRVRAQMRGLTAIDVRFAAADGGAPSLIAALRGARTARRETMTWLEPLRPSFGGTPAERAARAAAAYFASAESPLCIVLDDVDLADAESRTLAVALADESERRVRDGITGRGLALIVSAESAAAIEPFGAAKLALDALDRETARALLLSLLRPIEAAESVIEAALVRAKGSPLRLRRLATALRDDWRGYRTIPPSAAIPDTLPGTSGTTIDDWQCLAPIDREIIHLLALCDRSMTLREILAITGKQRRDGMPSLARLEAFEVVESHGSARRRRYRIVSRESADGIRRTIPPREQRRMHARAIRYLRSLTRPGLSEREALARHMIASGDRIAGAALASEIAALLRAKGSYGRAVDLLEDALAAQTSRASILELAEMTSSLLEEVGDDRRAAGIMARVFEGRRRRSREETVRLGRLLGVHRHRSGDPAGAREVFDIVLSRADEELDRDDLILIDTELAEMSNFEGHYDAAARACESGLRRLSESRGPPDFRGRMNLMLRASRGHIALRTLELGTARAEFLQALADSRRFGTLGDRAAILHNLGVIENQDSDFPAAKRYFSDAASILLRAGESQNLIKIATNLALIEAKIGTKRAASGHLETAASLLRQHPGDRLECFGAYSRGLVSLHFGDCDDSIAALREAIALAKRLGDRALGRFAEVHLAEAMLLCGRYDDALVLLKRKRSSAAEGAEPVVERMALARLCFFESILCRRRASDAAMKKLDSTPRSAVRYIETWNDLFIGASRLLRGDECRTILSSVRTAFEELGIAAGVRFATLALLIDALLADCGERARDEAARLQELPPSENRVLRTAEPVALAAAFARESKFSSAEEQLAIASRHIVGAPFLEVDWPLEFLRSSLALERGDLGEARRHLHRCLHCRDLLIRSVPASCRERFLGHARFDALRAAASRLSFQPIAVHSTERLRRATGMGGLVGLSRAMQGIYATIERLRAHDVPVFVSGETGSGKDLVARTLHGASSRSRQPLVVVDCACLPDALLEAELFGYEAGAFTGAEIDRPGLLAEADGGAALLAGIDQISLEGQAKILRAIESRSIRKLGATEPTRVDIRWIATASADPRALIAERRLRDDLYYRLAGAELRIPALRERPEDIPLLVEHFLEQHAQRLDRAVSAIDAAAIEALALNSWPGNVRELESCLFRILVELSGPEAIRLSDVRRVIGRELGSMFAREPRLLDRSLDTWRRDLEREYLARLFVESGGDADAMMECLGVKSTKLYAWLRDLGLDVRELRQKVAEQGS